MNEGRRETKRREDDNALSRHSENEAQPEKTFVFECIQKLMGDTALMAYLATPLARRGEFLRSHFNVHLSAGDK